MSYFRDEWLSIYEGDCRAVLRDLEPESVHCVVTSPPYWGLRDYGTAGQLGLEATPEEYVATMVDVFREVRRVLRADGTCWLNLGDSYARSQKTNVPQTINVIHGYPTHAKAGSSDAAVGRGERPGSRAAAEGLASKQLVGIPWRVAFALQADGWYLRSDIIWSKPNPMPESVTDRPTKSHEYLFLLSKSPRYFYDADAVREPMSLDTHPSGNGFDRGGVRISRGEGSGKAWFPPGAHGTRAADGNGMRMAEKYDNPSGRNLRSVWNIATAPYPGAHFATFPPKLVEPCIKAGCPEGGTVLDPFAGTGTVGLVAQRLSRRAVLIDLNADYLRQCLIRNAQTPLGLEVPA